MASFDTRAARLPSAYDRLQTWRAKQHAFNKARLAAFNVATGTIFGAGVAHSRQIGDLAVKAAVARMTRGVDKLV